MKRHWSHTLIVTGAGVAFAAAIAWPTLALLIECLRDATLPVNGFQPGMRQWHLLARTAWLAAGAVVACLVCSLPAVWAIGCAGIHVGRGIMFLGVALLLCPPMVYAFGWDRVAPGFLSPSLRCILVWSLWAWPVPAWVIGSAWSQRRNECREAALLEASGWRLMIAIALPNLRTHIALSAAILFVLFFNDYGVPHACGLTVYATELLGWATSSIHPIDTIAPALPSIGVTAAALLMAVMLWRKQAAEIDITHVSNTYEPKRSGPTLALALMLLLSWGLPIAALVADLSAGDIETAIRTYSHDVIGSLAVSSFAGVIVVWIAVAVWRYHTCRRVAMLWAITFGALPGALIGESLIAAYNRAGFEIVYAYWPILAIGYVARFAWVGLCLAGALHRYVAQSLIDQAVTDGASGGAVMRHVVLPIHWSALATAAGLVTVLSVAELPVSSMVRPPGLAPISLVIIEKFHRYEDGLLITLSLALVAIGTLAAACWALAERRRQKLTG